MRMHASGDLRAATAERKRGGHMAAPLGGSYRDPTGTMLADRCCYQVLLVQPPPLPEQVRLTVPALLTMLNLSPFVDVAVTV
jgi:hypothetical protein